MKNIKIIVGANYGDEGKGLATNYFAKCAKENNESVIVVLHNGGFQRGHTVIHNGIRHVFHAFSSGTFQNATTFYSSEFILNPMFFKEEYEKLTSLGFSPKVYVDPRCRLTTPYDVMINQIVEEYRGNKRHGSCGYGIFETIKRNIEIPFIVKDVIKNDLEGFTIDTLFRIRENYTFYRLEEHGLENVSIKNIQMILNNNIISKYVEDLKFMMQHIEIKDTNILDSFDTIIFEGSQGLLLDQSNIGKTCHLTPSNTNLTNPANIIKELKMLGYLKNANVETCYITRTYLTRHGAGEFIEECKKEEINKDMYDLTNVPNDYQGGIRYGYIDIDDLLKRIKEDSKKIPDNSYYLFVTHLNETNNSFFLKDGKLKNVLNVDKVKYISNKETNVEVLK